MANVGALNVNLALQAAQFLSGLRNAAHQTQVTANTIQRTMDVAKTAVKGLAAAFTIDFISGQIHKAFDYADAIQDLSDRTAFSTKTIQEFGYAAQISGSSVESAGAGLEKFSKTLGQATNGNQQAIKTLRDYGITAKDADTALRQASDGIAKLSTRSAQAAATAELFGKKNQNLTATLAGGSAALDDFAKKAEALGIVLDKDVIANAGQVNDKLDTLKMIVNAEMANAIVKNADGIASLADGMIKLTSSLLQFWQQNPKAALAIVGALGGGVVGGAPGAAIGGIAGYMAGSSIAGGMEDGSNDIRFRQKKMLEAKRAYHTALNTSPAEEAYANERGGGQVGGSVYVDGAKEEYQKQIGLMKRALAAAKAGKAGGGGAPNYSATGQIGAVDTSKEQAEAVARMRAYLSQVDRAQDEYLTAKQDLSSDIIEQSALEREMLDKSTQAKKAEIDLDSKLTESQKDVLKGMEDKVALEKADLINRRENETLAKQALDIKTAGLNNERDLLSSQEGLAKTQAERRTIGLRLVDLQFEQERLAQEAILASNDSNQAEKDIATARLKILDELKGNAQKSVVNATMGPGESFLKSIPSTIGEIDESLQQATVQGLGGLQDGLIACIKGTGDLKSAFKSMASSIIDGLLKIAIQQAIIKPLGEALFGSSDGEGGGKSTGGFLGSLVKTIGKSVLTKSATTGHANGGLTQAGSFLVGERGPEIVNIGAPGTVMTNNQLRAMNRGANDNYITVNVNGVNDPAMVKAMVAQGILQAMPVNAKFSSDFTLSKAQRPRM